MNDQVTLYTNPQSRGRIARWMLEEVSAPYQTEVLEYDGSMKAPAYLKINPMGKVPAIVHRGEVITECAAICAYLAETFPQAGLAPTAEERASYYRWMFFAAGPLEAAVTDLKVFGMEADAEKQRMVGYGSYTAVLDNLSNWFAGHAYVAGERFTAADVYVGAQINWGVEFGTLEKRPEFIDYAKRVAARDAYRRATEKDDALMEKA
ncbi:glutathione S-transferase family protein [Microbulbifer hydrolyticus]|uniref:Glutathione S-transferase n=1 Tax=Microbulbifer hydrolyticus TaxID=48074 RepID=A0A6P1T8D9_9GAMM|nr:glutathione S-transferase family protein [Microbulbifer hydrolyticus]MBB5211209.1 glutathione S-transferase [Microbulbifer hydrolyticus]QHQ38021.1 glutathione S-transferase [Microbulbifer hydrolyticus]